ncbi:hypothetical protein HWV62_5634 [Athelia sp. TMB]|nr:hypothetical protein HWV62_5634 [Athelia sp. TMB]
MRSRSTGSPIVKLDSAIVTGISSNSSATEQFLGIPFAQPPTGNLRYNLPVANQPYNSSILFDPPHSDSEDCLTINVIRPVGYETVKLPIVAVRNFHICRAKEYYLIIPQYIFGGGFDTGGSDTYDGSTIVQKSVNIQSPVIYVSFNHRTNGFGFLASQEITDAGVANLGIQDQRLALRWVKKYIASFGGDPKKVTLFGVSSGAMSAAIHMLLNNGDNEGLFRAAFLLDGPPIPVGSYTHGQKYYDGAVIATNCTGANDTLACLRTAPAEALQAYFMTLPNKASYQSLGSSWVPRVDGKLLKEDPQQLILKGSVAKIPFISGDCEDEGTLFSLIQSNITTDADFREFVNTIYYPNATAAEIDLVVKLYPSDLTAGSPFGTGDSDSLYPQYKRLAAFQGDNYHTIDTLNMFGSTSNGTELQDYLINFAYNLNPNGRTVPAWPQYEVASKKLLTFVDGAAPNATEITEDTYRAEALAGLTAISLKYPL